jgi:hypothetical protein
MPVVSSENHLTKAEHPAPHQVVNHKKSGRTHRVPLHQVSHNPGHHWVDSAVALGTQGTIFTNSTHLDFNLQSPSITYAQSIDLMFTITNTNGSTACTLVDAPFLFQFIEVYSGDQLLETVYPEHIQAAWRGYSTEKLTKMAAAQNWSATDLRTAVGGDGTLAASGVATYIMNIPCCYTRCPIPISLMKGSLRFRIYLATGTTIFMTGSVHSNTTEISVSDMQLYIYGNKLSEEAVDRIRQERDETGFTSAYYNPQRQVLSGLNSLAKGKQISQTLTSLTGFYSVLVFFLRDNSASRDKRYQGALSGQGVYLLDDLALLDSNGQSYYPQQISEKYNRYVLESCDFTGLFNTLFAWYPWNFSITPEASLENGIPNSVYLDGSWRFQGTTVATASGNFELVSLGWRLSNIVMDRAGNVNVDIK